MKIDKASFLVLASAMVAGPACVVNSVDDDGVGGAGVGGDASGGDDVGGSSSGGAGGAGGSAGGAGGGGGGVCDDTLGSPAACDGLDAECQPYCNGAHAYLKAGLAEEAVQCLADSTDCIVDGYACLTTALAGACPDETADAGCESVKNWCGDPDPGGVDCEQILPGMTDDGRTEVLACAEADCSFGVYSCLEGMLYLP